MEGIVIRSSKNNAPMDRSWNSNLGANLMGNRRLPDGTVMEDTVWKQVRQRAIASKDPICALCGGEIDMEAPAQHPMSCQVDHIVPVSRGGAPYDIDNLQLTHARCNRIKGNMMQHDKEDLSDNLCPISNNW